MIILRPKQVTPANFARFGSVVTAPQTAPTSQAADYKFWSDLAHYRIDGETEIGICTVYHMPVSIITEVERHEHTPEILIPINAPFALPLLRDGDSVEQAELFRVGIGEAVVIDAGIWHGPCLPIGCADSSYFVIFARRTPHADVRKKEISPIEIMQKGQDRG